ncbi:MAG TPA: hypothetical protein VL356_13875 [Acidocella sp.]|jgi:hypothetical protein|nr:hypothetical protein [Acidocella sp.]
MNAAAPSPALLEFCLRHRMGPDAIANLVDRVAKAEERARALLALALKPARKPRLTVADRMREESHIAIHAYGPSLGLPKGYHLEIPVLTRSGHVRIPGILRIPPSDRSAFADEMRRGVWDAWPDLVTWPNRKSWPVIEDETGVLA